MAWGKSYDRNTMRMRMAQTQGKQMGEWWILWQRDKRDTGLAGTLTVKQVPTGKAEADLEARIKQCEQDKLLGDRKQDFRVSVEACFPFLLLKLFSYKASVFRRGALMALHVKN